MSKRRKKPSVEQISLIEYLKSIPDPRIDRTKQHKLIDILMIAVCAAICGAETWTEVEEFGETKADWLSQFLELPNGIPSHDTFGRVFARLDPDAFEQSFIKWVQSLSNLKQEGVIAIDGKTLRGSYDKHHQKGAIHLVNAWASESRLILGQKQVDRKSNEITAIPELLSSLAIEGCLVTIDAMGTQTTIAKQIVEKGADYLFAVKENQKYLAQDLAEIFKTEFEAQDPFVGFEHDYAQTIGKDHGRIETRQCWTISDEQLITYIRDHQAWTGLQTIALVRAKRQVNGQESVQDRYYISSLPVDAETILKASRLHWGVENSLHWVLDVVFHEDQSRMRDGDMAHNFALVRQTALNLLRHEKSLRKGLRTKQLKAALDENYLLKVLSSLF